MKFLEKPWKNLRKPRDIKLVTTKKEETIWYQNRIIILQIFSKKICWLKK